MAWEVAFLREALDDLRRLDGSVRTRVLKAIQKAASNPVSQREGGYGKPLGRHGAVDLVGLFKIKLRSDGIRVVYRLERLEGRMLVVVVGVRTNDDVYDEAARRRRRHGL